VDVRVEVGGDVAVRGARLHGYEPRLYVRPLGLAADAKALVVGKRRGHTFKEGSEPTCTEKINESYIVYLVYICVYIYIYIYIYNIQIYNII